MPHQHILELTKQHYLNEIKSVIDEMPSLREAINEAETEVKNGKATPQEYADAWGSLLNVLLKLGITTDEVMEALEDKPLKIND